MAGEPSSQETTAMLNLIDTLKRTNEDMQGKLSELVHVQQQV